MVRAQIVDRHPRRAGAGAPGESDLAARWADNVETPTARAHPPVPALVTVPSPYRATSSPLIDYILAIKARHPDL
jgi:hypothetical protein